jgi:alkanesulfonate monooxygenase SsuD/methylene tetrahydromethanopterin reductase-like flavin-dependent oxidoreductase (luciferase family)
LEFGWNVVPDAADPPLREAQEADRLGLDLLGVQDHPYQRRFLDTWATLWSLVSATARIRVFPDVTCLPLRPAPVLAKTAASLDVLSGGRVEMGLGAGAFWDAIEAYGGPRLAPAEALEALEEAIDVLRLLWTEGRGVQYRGNHYQLRGAQPGPLPAHRIEIWLGVGGPKAVALAGRVADGWLPSLGPVSKDGLLDLHSRLDDAAASAGRDPADVRRLLNVSGDFAAGANEKWIDQFTELAVMYGIDTFIAAPQGPDKLAQLQRYANDVVPAVREHVARHRGR